MGMEGLHNSQKYRVQVWKSHRTHRRSGNGYGRAYIAHRSTGYRYGSHTELTEDPGMGMEGIHTSQKYRVQVWKSYRTHKSSV